MRGKPAPKRKLSGDPKYNNPEVMRFINLIMRQGKKSTAQTVVYDAFAIMHEKTKKDPVLVFDTAIKNVSPMLEVKSRRIGGANYQVPIEVRGDRQQTLPMRWIIDACRNKKGAPMAQKLATELVDASNKLGEAMKKREDVHRMAEANRAFAHFA